MSEPLETFWAEVLSSDPARVRSAVERLSDDEQRAVVAHLRRMASGPGWSEAQRARARLALDTLGTDEASGR